MLSWIGVPVPSHAPPTAAQVYLILTNEHTGNTYVAQQNKTEHTAVTVTVISHAILYAAVMIFMHAICHSCKTNINSCNNINLNSVTVHTDPISYSHIFRIIIIPNIHSFWCIFTFFFSFCLAPLPCHCLTKMINTDGKCDYEAACKSWQNYSNGYVVSPNGALAACHFGFTLQTCIHHVVNYWVERTLLQAPFSNHLPALTMKSVILHLCLWFNWPALWPDALWVCKRLEWYSSS